MPKPVKLLEGIGNEGNGALIRSTEILWTNSQHFILLQSTGVYGKPSPVEHLRIYILCPCRRALLYRRMLILACLTGVTGLVVNIYVNTIYHFRISIMKHDYPVYQQLSLSIWQFCTEGHHIKLNFIDIPHKIKELTVLTFWCIHKRILWNVRPRLYSTGWWPNSLLLYWWQC